LCSAERSGAPAAVLMHALHDVRIFPLRAPGTQRSDPSHLWESLLRAPMADALQRLPPDPALSTPRGVLLPVQESVRAPVGGAPTQCLVDWPIHLDDAHAHFALLPTLQAEAQIERRQFAREHPCLVLDCLVEHHLAILRAEGVAVLEVQRGGDSLKGRAGKGIEPEPTTGRRLRRRRPATSRPLQTKRPPANSEYAQAASKRCPVP
jgi:hypothetical protein